MNNMLPAHWLKHLTLDEAQHYMSAGLIEVTHYSSWIQAVAEEARELRNRLSYAEDSLSDLEREKNNLIEDLQDQLSAYER